MKLIYCLLPWLSQPNLGQIKLSGTVLESSGRADSKTVPGFDNWPRFVGVIEQNKIQRTYEHDCILELFLEPNFHSNETAIGVSFFQYSVMHNCYCLLNFF